MTKIHNYTIRVKWTGNKGKGTLKYNEYGRDHIIYAEGKENIHASSDPLFQGDQGKINPEELLLSSISACHMLWYLHLCADAGIVVVEYTDSATAEMNINNDGSGRFASATLNPEIIITDQSMLEKAFILHKKANEMCFIANSLNFKVFHKPVIHFIN